MEYEYSNFYSQGYDDEYDTGHGGGGKKKSKKTPKKSKNKDLTDPLADTEPDLDDEEREAMTSPKKKKKKKKDIVRNLGAELDEEEELHPSTIKVKSSPSKTNAKAKGKSESTVQQETMVNDGMFILMSMSDDDVKELLERVDAQCPLNDEKRFKARETAVNWDNVTFSSYGPHQCKLAWNYISTNARKFRILHEIVEEVRVNLQVDPFKFRKKVIEGAPGFPQKPYGTGAFQVFCKEKWDRYKSVQEKMNSKVQNFVTFQTKCQEEWSRLPENRKSHYDEICKETTAEYQRKVKEFYAQFPGFNPSRPKLTKEGRPEKPLMTETFKKKYMKMSSEMFKDAPPVPLTPVKLFMNSKLNRMDPPPTGDELTDCKIHYMEKWKSLSNKKKLKWIESCIRQCETYMIDVRKYKQTHPLFLLPSEFHISKLVIKDEFNIWATAHGAPPRPKNSVFELFLEEFRNSENFDEDAPEEDIRKEATNKWNELGKYNKEMYQMQFKMQSATYKRDVEGYFNDLPPLLKQAALEVIPKKYQKALMTEVDKDPLVFDDDDQVSSAYNDRTTKRKASEGVDSDEDEDEGKKKKKRKKEGSSDGSVPLYMVELTDEHRQLLEQQMKEITTSATEGYNEKRAKAKIKLASKNVDKVSGAFATNQHSNKPSTSKFFPGEVITPQKLTEAIRGIFDGLQTVGRTFSVYYYYAKYVSREKSWAQLYSEIGVVGTAARMLETFHRLGKHKQQVFIDEAFKFFKKRYYGNKISNEDDLFNPNLTCYPEEPKPPPRKAADVYVNDMKVKQLQNPRLQIVPWCELDEKTQMYYIKIMYRQMKTYVQDYEEFVKKMTPNDVVQYVVKKCTDWDSSYLKRVTVDCNDMPKILTTAAKDFGVPFSRITHSAELSEDGQDSEPEIHETAENMSKKIKWHSFKYRKNPFSVYGCPDTKLQKNWQVHRLTDELKRESTEVDSDLPSSSSDEEMERGSINKYSEKQRRKAFRRKIKELQTYRYPLDDLYELPNMSGSFIINNAWGSRQVAEAGKRILDSRKFMFGMDIGPSKASYTGSKPVSKSSPQPSTSRKCIQRSLKVVRKKKKAGPKVKLRANLKRKASKITATKISTSISTPSDKQRKHPEGKITQEDSVATTERVCRRSPRRHPVNPTFMLVSSSPCRIPSTPAQSQVEEVASVNSQQLPHTDNSEIYILPHPEPPPDLVTAALHFTDPSDLEPEKSIRLREGTPELFEIDSSPMFSQNELYYSPELFPYESPD